MSVSGSLLAIQIDSASYEIDSEADLTEMPPKEIEGRPTSGNTLYKVTKKVPERTGIDLVIDGVDKQILTDLLGIVVPISYTEADGTVNSGPAMINIEQRTTQENKMTIGFIPQGLFTVFPP